MSTIEKALGLLEHFSGQSPEIGLSDFKRLTAFDKGTVHRYLTALRACGFLEQNPATKAYRLGPAVIRLSAVREKTVPLVNTVAPFVQDLAELTEELVHAALPQATGMSMIYALDGGHSGTRVAFDEAEILPFHATSSGLAQLAFGRADDRDPILSQSLPRHTAATLQSRDALEEAIAATQRRGYARAEQTFETDVCSVAVPFFGPDPFAMGTIALATPAARMAMGRETEFVRALIRASATLSHGLGGAIPPALCQIWALIDGPRKQRETPQ